MAHPCALDAHLEVSHCRLAGAPCGSGRDRQPSLQLTRLISEYLISEPVIARKCELASLLARIELFRCGLQNFATSDPTLDLCASGIQGAGTSEPGKWPSRTTKRRPFATRRSQLPPQRDCSFLKPPGHACIWALPVARGLPSRDRLPQCPSIMVRERWGMGTCSNFWEGRDDSANGNLPNAPWGLA